MDNNGNELGGLSTRAMLCGLSISMWGNRKLDKAMSREASASRAMGERVGRYNKWLLVQDEEGTPVKEYTAIVSVRNKAGVVHRDMTLPWMDDGTRINSARNYIEWGAAMREQKNAFETAVEHFIREYPNLVMRTKQIMDEAAAKENKPSMFSGRHYPSQAEMMHKFQFTTSVLPLPESTDFRVKLGDSQVKSIRKQIEAHLNSQVMNSTQHLFERLGDLVDRVVLLGEPKSAIQSALVRDIAQVTSIAERLNIAGDRYLDEFARRIRKELSFEPVMLKTCEGEREALAARAARIQSDMSAFMGEYSDV